MALQNPERKGRSATRLFFFEGDRPSRGEASRLVLSCLLTLYTAVMSFEILFPFGLWVSEPGWLLNHSQLV